MGIEQRKEDRAFASWIFAGRLFDEIGVEIPFIPIEASQSGIGILAEKKLTIGASYVMLLPGGVRLTLICRSNGPAGDIHTMVKLLKAGLEATDPTVDIRAALKRCVMRH